MGTRDGWGRDMGTLSSAGSQHPHTAPSPTDTHTHGGQALGAGSRCLSVPHSLSVCPGTLCSDPQSRVWGGPTCSNPTAPRIPDPKHSAGGRGGGRTHRDPQRPARRGKKPSRGGMGAPGSNPRQPGQRPDWRGGCPWFNPLPAGPVPPRGGARGLTPCLPRSPARLRARGDSRRRLCSP